VFQARHWLAGEAPDIFLHASVGIASYPEDATTPQAIVHRADEMMYQVKQAGRNNIAVAGVGVVGLEEAR